MKKPTRIEQADDRHVVGLGDDVAEVVVGHAQAEEEQEQVDDRPSRPGRWRRTGGSASIAMKPSVAPTKKVVGPETKSIGVADELRQDDRAAAGCR